MVRPRLTGGASARDDKKQLAAEGLRYAPECPIPAHVPLWSRTMAVITASPPGVLAVFSCSAGPVEVESLPHRLVLPLGVAWVLDGFETTIASSISRMLGHADTLHMSSTAVCAVAMVYLLDIVVGALLFVRLCRSWISRPSRRGPSAMLSLLDEEACECTDQVDAAERLAEEELPLWVDLQPHDLAVVSDLQIHDAHAQVQGTK
jgi:hypothetical protein